MSKALSKAIHTVSQQRKGGYTDEKGIKHFTPSEVKKREAGIAADEKKNPFKVHNSPHYQPVFKSKKYE